MKNILYTATNYQKNISIQKLDGENKYIYIDKKIRNRKFLDIGYREKLKLYIYTGWSIYKKYLYRKKISSGNDLKNYIYTAKKKKKKYKV